MTALRLKDIADALGVKPPQATRYAQRGMPTHDIEAARQWKRDNIRERITPPSRPPEGATAAGPPQIVADDGGVDYWKSRARRENAEASIAELKLQEQRGDLMRREVARNEIATLAKAFRDALMQSKARLAPVLLEQSDVRQVEQILDAEFRHVLAVAAAV